MSKKLRIYRTETNNLISNLRGEVGEILFTWVLMRNLITEANELRTSDSTNDLNNPRLLTLDIMIDKLSNEIVARLSELAEPKIGCLTFYFAQEKLKQFKREVEDYQRFIEKNRFREKRNYDISHKELPEKWSDHKYIHIPYKTLLKGMAAALRLMKKIDATMLGPSARYLWREMRKRRYIPIHPAKAGYMLLPYLSLSKEDRARIILKEVAEGREVWVDMKTTVNGLEVTVKACKDWGAILLGQRLLLLDQYPLIELTNIEIELSGDDQSSNQGDSDDV